MNSARISTYLLLPYQIILLSLFIMTLAPLYHLVYQSTATTLLSEQNLAELLTQARAWNTSHDLTGLLLYSHGNVLQVLEGSQQEVEYIFNRIRQDHRHFQVTKLADGPIRSRNFSQWSMGFKVVDAAAFQQLLGYQNPESPAYLSTYSENDNASLHALLTGFVTEEEVAL